MVKGGGVISTADMMITLATTEAETGPTKAVAATMTVGIMIITTGIIDEIVEITAMITATMSEIVGTLTVIVGTMIVMTKITGKTATMMVLGGVIAPASATPGSMRRMRMD